MFQLDAICVAVLLAFNNSQNIAPQPHLALNQTTDSILQQMTTATGWNLAAVPLDGTASGSLTILQGDTPTAASWTLSVKGCREFKVSKQDANGSHSLVVNGDSAVITEPEGTQSVPDFATVSMYPIELPFFCLPEVLASAATRQATGVEAVNGEAAYRIDISSVPLQNDPHASERMAAGKFSVWISTGTGLPIQLSSTSISTFSPASNLITTHIYGDFRSISGMAVPFHQEQYLNGQLLSSLQLNSVSFNTGLTDSDFALPAVQQ